MFRLSSFQITTDSPSFSSTLRRSICNVVLTAIVIGALFGTTCHAQQAERGDDSTEEVRTEEVKQSVAPTKGTGKEHVSSQQKKRLQIKKIQVTHNHFNDTRMTEYFHFLHMLMKACVVLFFVWLGASLGSFLNVVIYRMPAGMNLSKPKSRCPRCMTSIRFRHNVPVLGWFILRGKCYDCQVPISFRYPLIESIVAFVFGGLLYWVVVSGGAYIPEWTVPQLSGLIRLISSSYGNKLLGWYLWHSTLLTLLLAMGMIHYDREKIPTKLLIFALILGLGIPVVLPTLYPLPTGIPLFESFSLGRTFNSLIKGPVIGVVGAVCGGVLFFGLGLLFKQKTSNDETSSSKTNANILRMGLVVGCFLGWQATATIAALLCFTSLCCLVAARKNLYRALGVLLFVLTGFQLVWWRELHAVFNGEDAIGERISSLMVPAGTLGLVIVGLVCFLRCIKEPVQTEESPIAGAPTLAE